MTEFEGKLTDIGHSRLNNLAGLLDKLFETSRLIFDKDSIKIIQSDRPSVIFIDITLDYEIMFEQEEYKTEAEHIEVYVKSKNLKNMLQSVHDPVLKIEKDCIILEGVNNTYKLKRFGKNPNESIPDMSKLEHDAVIKIDGNELFRAVNDAENVGSSLKFKFNNNTLTCESKRGINQFIRTFNDVEVVKNESEESIESMYPLEYLTKLKSIGNEELKIYLNNDYPLKISSGKSYIFLAPRVNN